MPSRRTQVLHNPQSVLTLTTLGAKTTSSLATKIDSSNEQGVKLVKVKAVMNFAGKTGAEGPLIVGLAAGLTTTEISDCFAADPQQHKDPQKAERANFRVFPIWHIGYNMTNTVNAPELPLHYKHTGIPSWLMNESEELSWFVFNQGSAALTTGTIVRISDVMVVRWERD